MKKNRNSPKKLAPSTHAIVGHADGLRSIVQTALANAGINDLSLRSMQFDAAGPGDPCPPNQHREMVCTTGPGGAQVCEWKCVAN